MGAVLEVLALLPLVDGGLCDAEASGQRRCAFCAGGDLGTHGGRGSGVLVQGDHHGVATPGEFISSMSARNTARAIIKG